MKLKYRLLLAMSVIVALVLAIFGWLVSRHLTAQAAQATARELDGAHDALEAFLRMRYRLLVADGRLVAESPVLKAILTTPGISESTIASAVGELKLLAGSDLVLVTDGRGALISSAPGDATRGVELKAEKPIDAALQGRDAAGLWLLNGRLYQAIAVPIRFGRELHGALALGYLVDDALAGELARITSCLVAIFRGNTLVAAHNGGLAIPASAGGRWRGELAEQLSALHSQRGVARVIPVSGHPVMSAAFELPGLPSTDAARYLIGKPLDRMIASTLELQQYLWLVGSVALLLALTLSFWAGGTVAAPIQVLVAAAQDIASGNTQRRVRLDGSDELGILGRAFDEMVQRLSESTAEQARLAAEAATAAAERRKNEELSKLLVELRETQAQLVQSSKLAAVGELAGGIAHELNNPLSAVLTFSILLRERVASLSPELVAQLPEMPQHLGIMEGAARRCKQIADNLLFFSRPAESHIGKTVVAEVVNHALELVAGHLREKRTRVVLDIPPGTQVWASENEVEQVLVNLALNAVQLMPENGQLTLKAGDEDDRTFIDVTDTGPGIPEEIRPRIFDPFFTTKPRGKGTGLGLSIVYRIIEKHGGRISVDSTVGVGTTFRIVLPKEKPQ